MQLKLTGLIFWILRLDDIRTYGIGSALFDAQHSYKKNLFQVMKQKKVIIDYQRVKTLKDQPAKYLIHPESKFKNFWNIVVLLLLLYTFSIMPYLVAFEDVKIGSGWWYTDTVVDILFF
jgi:hypothetical protein